jgi:hypothetical protein
MANQILNLNKKAISNYLNGLTKQLENKLIFNYIKNI